MSGPVPEQRDGMFALQDLAASACQKQQPLPINMPSLLPLCPFHAAHLVRHPR